MRKKDDALYVLRSECQGVGNVAGERCPVCAGTGYQLTGEGQRMAQVADERFLALMRS
jgi:DnaJ-class molecular chaperone